MEFHILRKTGAAVTVRLEGVKMNAIFLNRLVMNPRRSPAAVAATRWALLMAAGAILTACQFAPVRRTPVTETPAVADSSIAGRAWLDECGSGESCPTVTPGAIQNTGNQEPSGVQSLAGLDVSLGTGPCPALGLASQQTDENGSFFFQGLEPGFYCVTVQNDASMAGQWILPAALPSEHSASYTIALGPGEHRRDLAFAWKSVGEQTPAPATATPTSVPTCTNQLSLVDDVTIEDGQRIDPGASFRKVWRVRNEGSCTWNGEYEWVFVSGYQLNAPDSARIPAQVAPDVMMDISLDMKAPVVSGTYRSYWMMRSPAGELFGAGAAFNEPVWVEIKVGPEPTPDITHWRGEYFDGKSLEGEPALVRNDKQIDFDWGRKAPSEGLSSDSFSARWTRTLDFDAAIYRFTVDADDGVRLWVDDRLVIDEWSDSDSNRGSVDLAMVSGKHTIKLEYYENRGDARVSLSWKKVSIEDSSKWLARFWFNRQRDSKWALVKTPAEIDYDWGSKPPALGIPADDFSASWTRMIDFEAGKYRFSLSADDGVRLYLDGALLIDEWHDGSASETYSIEREINGKHEVQVLFYEHKGNASIEFGWVKVGPPNQAPIAQSDGYETTFDTPINVLDPGVLENDNDPDGDLITAIKVSGPSHGELVLHENGAFSYRPEPGYTGEDSFVYRASDGKLESADTLVKITIQREDQLPAAVDDLVETQEDTPVRVDVLANDRGLGDTPIRIVTVSIPLHGEAVIDGASVVYTPDPDFYGEDSFTYTIADNDGDESSAIVTVGVNAVNDPPSAGADSYEVNEDETLTLPDPGVLENDSDPEGTAISAVLIEGVEHGTLRLNTDGSFSYVPDENYSGADQFSYSATDGNKSSAPVTVSLVVRPVEDPPVAVEDAYDVLFDQILVVDPPGVLANDFDPDNDDLTAVLDQGPAHGTLVLSGDGSFEYTVETGYSGEDSYSYWVEDGKGKSVTVSVKLEILPTP
jgi:hypothetical protein